MAEQKLPKSCDEASLAVVDLIAELPDWESAHRAALEYSLQILTITCADGDHRIYWSIAGVLDAMTEAEKDGTSIKEFAETVRTHVEGIMQFKNLLAGTQGSLQ